MAHKKGVGSSKNGRESAAQRLGVKIWGGQKCVAGNLLTVWLTSRRAATTRARFL